MDFQIVTSFIGQNEQSLLEVEGRFVEGDMLTVGNIFDLLLVNGDIIPIKLKINKIEAYKRSFDFISIGWTAKLFLLGKIPFEMKNKNYLSSMTELPILRGFDKNI